jgi:hypothetical protein
MFFGGNSTSHFLLAILAVCRFSWSTPVGCISCLTCACINLLTSLRLPAYTLQHNLCTVFVSSFVSGGDVAPRTTMHDRTVYPRFVVQLNQATVECDDMGVLDTRALVSSCTTA